MPIAVPTIVFAHELVTLNAEEKLILAAPIAIYIPLRYPLICPCEMLLMVAMGKAQVREFYTVGLWIVTAMTGLTSAAIAVLMSWLNPSTNWSTLTVDMAIVIATHSPMILPVACPEDRKDLREILPSVGGRAKAD